MLVEGVIFLKKIIGIDFEQCFVFEDVGRFCMSVQVHGAYAILIIITHRIRIKQIIRNIIMTLIHNNKNMNRNLLHLNCLCFLCKIKCLNCLI